MRREMPVTDFSFFFELIWILLPVSLLNILHHLTITHLHLKTVMREHVGDAFCLVLCLNRMSVSAQCWSFYSSNG